VTKDDLKAVSARLDQEHTAASNAYRESLNEEKRLLLALDAAKKASHAALPIMDEAQRRASIAAHLVAGKCAGHIRSGDTWHTTTTRCTNTAKGDCPDCGGPHCGVHGKKRSYGYSHSCREWPWILNTLGVEKEVLV
jgi:hypothetical protein